MNVNKEALQLLDVVENAPRPLQPGDVVRGRIIGRKKGMVFVEIDNFGTGVLYGRELFKARHFIKDLKPGDEIEAVILELTNEEGYIELSVADALEQVVWKKLEEMRQQGVSLRVTIQKANKGGLITTVEGIQAFLPVSQLKAEHYPKVPDANPNEILKRLQQLVGKELEVKILTVNPRQNLLVLSERATELEETAKLLEDFEVGEVVEVEITSVVDFGAFCKFKAKKEDKDIEALIHISELDWRLILDPSEIVKPGDRVKAKIVEISNGRAYLSLKALKPNPWEKAQEVYEVGQVIEGEVVKVNSFGAFVKTDIGVIGLCHVSNFSSMEEMQEALKVGKKYKFEIVKFSPQEYKLILKPVLS